MGDMLLLLDPSAQAGRTGFRLNVKTAKRARAIARDELGVTSADTPDVRDLLRAAKAISALLFDATEGDARLMVQLGKDEGAETYSPAIVLGTF